MVCWTIWNRRIKAWAEEAVYPLDRLYEVAKQYLAKFRKAQPPPKQKIRAQRPRWKAPNQGNIKTNFDEVMFEDINSAGIGVVVLDDKGEVLAALAERILMPDSVLVLETLAA